MPTLCLRVQPTGSRVELSGIFVFFFLTPLMILLTSMLRKERVFKLGVGIRIIRNLGYKKRQNQLHSCGLGNDKDVGLKVPYWLFQVILIYTEEATTHLAGCAHIRYLWGNKLTFITFYVSSEDLQKTSKISLI